MKNKKIWIVLGLVVVIIVAMLVKSSGGEQVEVVKASRGSLTMNVEETGYVQAVNDHEVQAIQAGRVAELMVDVGTAVESGQTLMRLSNPDLTGEMASVRSQLAGTEAELQTALLSADSLNLELEQAKSDLDRKKALLKSGALAQAEYDQAQLQVVKLEKSLAQKEASADGLNNQLTSLGQKLGSLEEKMGELQVISPTTGTVLDLPVKAGQVAAPGTLLAQIGSDSQLEVEAELLSDEISRVKIGQTVRITAPVLGNEVLSGKVSKIYPRAYERISALGVSQRRVPVIIDLDRNVNLQPGYEVRVAIETLRKEGVILLPRESVRLTEDGKYRVLVVTEGRIRERLIEVREKNQQWVEVLKGIKVGETVVRDGSRELEPGSRVKTVFLMSY